MPDPRFHDRKGPFTLARLADAIGAELRQGAEDRQIVDVAPLGTAGPDDLSFLENRQYMAQFEGTAAGACIVRPELADRAPAGTALLVCDHVYRAYAVIAALFYPEDQPEPGIHPAAVVDGSARLAEGVRVEAGAVIGANAEIGAATVIGPNAVIGRGVVIGAHGWIGANVSISHALIGDKVRLHQGCAIGQDGFGFAMGAQGHLKVPQLGRVIIGDDVEIGANTAVDRGAGPDTVIGPGCRIDNLVQIGHNVTLGAGCVVVAQVGISGSCTIGRGVAIGGQAGIAGHLTVGDGVQIGAQSGLIADVPPGQTLIGSPARPIKDFWRETATLKKLAARPPR